MKASFSKDKKIFEKYIKDYCKKNFSSQDNTQKILKKSIEYTLLAKASRFRALLSMATARLLKQNEKKILPWALSVEMFHSGSLIHDDLPSLDNGTNRRGKKCNHLVFGEDIALLAGSTLFVESFLSINSFVSKKKELMNLFISKVGFHSLMSGQCLDLKLKNLSPNKALKMIQWKTGSLIEVSVEGPSLLWAKNKKEIQALKDYAYFLGLSYQLADDLQDKDLVIKNSENLLKQYTKNSLKSLSPFKDRAEELKTLSLKNEARALK